MPRTEALVELAERARLYEPEAFGEMFDLYYEKLRRYMYYHTGDLDASEDLASDVLTTAMEKIEGFDDRGGTLGAWLFGIARNLLARRREAASKSSQVELDEASAVPVEQTPEDLVLEADSHESLYEALSRLPDEQREVVLLRFLEGYSVKEVAGMIGRKPGAVRALQFRAVRALGRMYEGEWSGA
ncbi:MAG: sigma-70 family RNA polymerase sigma factor [Actinobacteria bacterium]|nr:sigma-70 family RNA polymerase sigma factor [Actinomycetota bacterium]MBU1945265.1 sigma-70 family RNA polymerase sigma factor [Actinomycetota bacterium]MBU2687837.1 sigma-70 family RNA polymerase sigma factor [Actinomycetota bacterium]